MKTTFTAELAKARSKAPAVKQRLPFARVTKAVTSKRAYRRDKLIPSD